ncbi:uncharacterized protein LOC126683149 [Mercurialis annua]|uniref:uncharacterized protein LOC126683149 n=1 Tax=Mercurialis annua TaxID=3986 RepID=UPI002160C0BA|nr:uncharacterized protein LOC126683149 [Mercurialis annua]
MSNLVMEKDRKINAMEEIRPAPSPAETATHTTTTATTADANQEKSAMSRVKKECLSFAVSVQESFRYIKAKLVGQAKKITARNEKEVAAADLQASKMEVQAADEAENLKNSL